MDSELLATGGVVVLDRAFSVSISDKRSYNTRSLYRRFQRKYPKKAIIDTNETKRRKARA